MLQTIRGKEGFLGLIEILLALIIIKKRIKSKIKEFEE